MRPHIITAALLLAPFAMLAAQDTSTTQVPQRDPIRGYNTPHTPMGPSDSLEGDHALVMRIHRINQMEIRAGQLAQRSGSSAKVRSYGQQLVRDHQAADQKLTTLAQRLGVTLREKGADAARRGQYGRDQDRHPMGRDTTLRRGQQDTTFGRFGQRGDSAWQGHQHDEMQEHGKMQRLQTLRGAEFDAEFANLMAQGHAKAISMLEQAQARTQHQELRTFIANTLPTLRVHLQVAQSLGGTFTTTTSSIQ
jgi:putative membrane protein